VESRNLERLWLATVIAGLVCIATTLALIIWSLSHPTPAWPEYDGSREQAPTPGVTQPTSR
jgi:hypothetical protein